MAASSAQLSLQWASLQSGVAAPTSSSPARCSSLSLSQRRVLSSVGCSSSSSRGRNSHVVCVKKGKKGGVAEAEESTLPSVPVQSSEADGMWMGKKLDGLEPDFWEGEQWDTFGFIVQYLWAFGILVSLVACGVAVRTYNTGAVDFKETEVYKEAMDSQVEMDASVFDQADSQGFTEPGQAPSLE